MAKDINDTSGVSALISQLEPGHAAMVEAIRTLILATDPSIGEQVKWNSPAFFYQGEMKAFDAKEYKRDIVVINTRKSMALLIFPTGAAIHDTSGILEGKYTDGRRMVTFRSMEDVEARGKLLQVVIRQWLNQVEK